MSGSNPTFVVMPDQVNVKRGQHVRHLKRPTLIRGLRDLALLKQLELQYLIERQATCRSAPMALVIEENMRTVEDQLAAINYAVRSLEDMNPRAGAGLAST